MTKKKIIIYLTVFIVAVWASAVFRNIILADPAKNFAPACKNVVSPQCQTYVLQISAQKKFDEAVQIQKVRIKENERILKFYKSKIVDKCLFEMDAKEAQNSLQACIGTQKGLRDYFLLKTAEFTVRDIFIDSLAVSQIQYSEFKDKKSAVKTLKHMKKILKQNKYVTNRDVMFKILDKELAEIK